MSAATEFVSTLRSSVYRVARSLSRQGFNVSATGLICACTLAWLALATPSARQALESTMFLQMLVQIPVLVALGAAAALAIKRLSNPDASITRHWTYSVWRDFVDGSAGPLVFAAVTLTIWMLPRSLDSAVTSGLVEAAKFLTVPAAGAAIAIGWPGCHRLVRVLIHVEVIATLFRFGWAYLAAPKRLCAVYLLDEQASVGTALLVIGTLYAILSVWPALFGWAPWQTARDASASKSSEQPINV